MNSHGVDHGASLLALLSKGAGTLEVLGCVKAFPFSISHLAHRARGEMDPARPLSISPRRHEQTQRRSSMAESEWPDRYTS